MVMVVGVVTQEEISPSPMRGLRQVSSRRLHPAPDVTPTSMMGGLPLRSPPPLGLSHLTVTVPTHGRAPPWVPAGNPGLTQDHIRGIRSVDHPHLKGCPSCFFIPLKCMLLETDQEQILRTTIKRKLKPMTSSNNKSSTEVVHISWALTTC